MIALKSLRLLDEDLGELFRSGLTGESLYYSASWQEICDKAKGIARKERQPTPADVRSADYALDLLGIPNQWVEADIDDSGGWMVYWR